MTNEMPPTAAVDPELFERALHPRLVVGRGVLAPAVEALTGRVLLLSQPGPLAAVDAAVRARADHIEIVASLAAEDLDALVASLPEADHVVGVGGGMTLDAAKSVAWRRELRLLLAPSVVSVDASVTNTIAVRRGGRVVYEGFVVADAIVADLDLIAAAPARLNRAGVGDLLSIHTGLADWRLGAAAGRIAFDEAIAVRAAAILEGLYGLSDEVAAVSDAALEAILRGYVEVNELCLRAGHSGPEEGSEHYFGYRLEAVTGRSFVHGELIGLGTALMANLQGNDPRRVVAFLDSCRVAWRPASQGLDRVVLRQTLVGLPAFVRSAGLPHSILDDAVLTPDTAEDLIAAVMEGAP